MNIGSKQKITKYLAEQGFNPNKFVITTSRVRSSTRININFVNGDNNIETVMIGRYISMYTSDRLDTFIPQLRERMAR